MPVPLSLRKYFNTMRYRSTVSVQSSGYFQSTVSYIKVQTMFKWKDNACKDEVLKQDNSITR